jgi:hypothetical protein
VRRWDRTPSSKPKEALFDGQPLNIETHQKNPLEYAASEVVKKLKSRPGYDHYYHRTKPATEDYFRHDNTISLVAKFKDGHEEGYDIIPERETDMWSSRYSLVMYKIIEDDFNNFMSYIPFEEDLLDQVYSPRLADIINRLGREIENFLKAWLKSHYADTYPNVEQFRNGRRKMSDLKNFFEPVAELSKQRVQVKNLGYTIYPFEDFQHSGDEVPFWWTLYNEQKHNAYESRKHATIRNTLYPLAALFVLNCLVPTKKEIDFFEMYGTQSMNFEECSSKFFVYTRWRSMLNFA